MRLFRSKEHPEHWIGEDEHSALVLWPARKGGWTKRTPYNGPKRQLEEVDPRLARGSGWPGGGRGPAPRGEASKPIGLRVTVEEREKWERAATERESTLSDWIRDTCNREADDPRLPHSKVKA
jgi:hypothetical protein